MPSKKTAKKATKKAASRKRSGKVCTAKGAEIPIDSVITRMRQFRPTTSTFSMVNGFAGLLNASYTRDQLRGVAKQLGISGRSCKWNMCWKIACHFLSVENGKSFIQLNIVTRG